MNDTERKPAAQLIIKGLLKQMKPIQALVFMAIYQQFPQRFIPNNDYFFQPSMGLIIKAMKISPAVYYLMLSRLVESGYIERRKHSRSKELEYRIVFEKLNGFIK